MFKGAALFALVFVFINSQSREFVTKLFTQTMEKMEASAPTSYVVALLLAAAMVVSIFVVKSWPQRVDPANPMAKYRRDMPSED